MSWWSSASALWVSRGSPWSQLCIDCRVGVNSAPELDFLANSKSNSGIELELALHSPGGIGIELELPSFELESELRSSELNSELPSWNLNPI